MGIKKDLRELAVKDGKITVPEEDYSLHLYSVDALVKYYEHARPSSDPKRDMVARKELLEDKFNITVFATFQKELRQNYKVILSFDKFLALADDKGIFRKVDWSDAGFIEEGRIINVYYSIKGSYFNHFNLTYDQFQQLGRPNKLQRKTYATYEKAK